jgi:hypothetical protein
VTAKAVVEERGDPRFHDLLRKIGELHDRKQADYGTGEDPLANIRGSESWGVRPWVGALIRVNDKLRRLQAFARKGVLANEGVEDSLMDISVYALLALILYREHCAEINGRYLGGFADPGPDEKRER